MYTDLDIAELYNVLNPWGPGNAFYHPLVMAAPSVLDVGCGTGMQLHRARASGHCGRLTGIDPDRGSLEVARRRSDIEWVEGTAAAMTWEREFDLAIMMSHAFQCLITDAEIRASLAAIHRALVDDGRFVFETRNPAVRAWERWNSTHPMDVVDGAGRAVRITNGVVSVDGDVVTLTETTSGRDGGVLRMDEGRLRFLAVDTLTDLLTEAGFVIDAQQGTWSGKPLAETAPEIITFARRP